MTSVIRPELGDFTSIHSFKAVIVGMEDALGEKATAIALTAAGRMRGKKLAEELGLVGKSVSLDETTNKMREALGEEGNRLCLINSITQEGDVFKVQISEAICVIGEPQGSSRKSSFTLGMIWGALEQVVGKRLQGQHTESSLRGQSHDVFELTTLA